MELFITCPEIPIALRERDIHEYMLVSTMQNKDFIIRKTMFGSDNKLEEFCQALDYAERQSIDDGFRIHEKQVETRNSDWGNHRCFNYVHRNMNNIKLKGGSEKQSSACN